MRCEECCNSRDVPGWQGREAEHPFAVWCVEISPSLIWVLNPAVHVAMVEGFFVCFYLELGLNV